VSNSDHSFFITKKYLAEKLISQPMGLKINKLAAYKLTAQIELLRNLMWVIIQDRFDVYTENLGVRKDFTIVSYEKDEDCENCGAYKKYSHQNNQMRGISMN
jgi:hypothetical protein